MTLRFRCLRAERILEYIYRLTKRVKDRFQKHGLAPVYQDVYNMADKAQAQFERIATCLSRKIWQKIMIIHQLEELL